MPPKTPKRNRSPSRNEPLSAKKARTTPDHRIPHGSPFTPRTSSIFSALTFKTPKRVPNAITHLIQKVAGQKNLATQQEEFKNYIKEDSSEHGWHLKATEDGRESLLCQIARHKPRFSEQDPLLSFLKAFWELLEEARSKKRTLDYKNDYDKACLIALKPCLLQLTQDDNKKIPTVLDSFPTHVKNNNHYYLMLSDMLTQAMADQKHSVIPALVAELTPLNFRKPIELILPYAKENTLPSFIAALSRLSFGQQLILFSTHSATVPLALLKNSSAAWLRHNAVMKEVIRGLPEQALNDTHQPTETDPKTDLNTIINRQRTPAIQRLKQKASEPDHNLFKMYLEFIIFDLITKELLKIRTAYLSKKTNPKDTQIKKSAGLTRRETSIAEIEINIASQFSNLFLKDTTTNNIIKTLLILVNKIREEVSEDHGRGLGGKLGFTKSTLADQTIPDALKQIDYLCEQAGVSATVELGEEKRSSCCIS